MKQINTEYQLTSEEIKLSYCQQTRQASVLLDMLKLGGFLFFSRRSTM